MCKLGYLTVIVLFLLGFGLTSAAVYAQSDLDDGWDDDDDDDEGWEDEKTIEREAYNKAKQGGVDECEAYLKKYPNGSYVDDVKKLMKKLKDKAEDEEENKYAGMSPAEIKRAQDKERDDLLNKRNGEDDGEKGPIDTVDRRTYTTGSKMSPEDFEYLWSGSSFWTIKRISQAHFGLSLSRTDWKGQITDGNGSHTVINAGTEYDLAEKMNKPASVFVDFGFKLQNLNPWDTDSSAVSGWLGGKYIFKELEPNQSKGLMYGATVLLGFGFGSREHEANLGIWIGPMNPPIFLLTPMVSAIVAYQLDTKSAINGTLGFMFFVGTEDEPEAYPLEQDSSFAINGSVEYYRGFELVRRVFGVHAGFTFRTAYDSMFSMYAKVNSRLGPYMQLVIPFTSSTSSVNMMFYAGYNLKFYKETRIPDDELTETS